MAKEYSVFDYQGHLFLLKKELVIFSLSFVAAVAVVFEGEGERYSCNVFNKWLTIIMLVMSKRCFVLIIYTNLFLSRFFLYVNEVMN